MKRRKTRLEGELDFRDGEEGAGGRNLDSSKAALERLLVELRDIIMADIKVKFAAPALFEYLNPDRHAATRKKLGIAEPANTVMSSGLFRSTPSMMVLRITRAAIECRLDDSIAIASGATAVVRFPDDGAEGDAPRLDPASPQEAARLLRLG